MLIGNLRSSLSIDMSIYSIDKRPIEASCWHG